MVFLKRLDNTDKELEKEDPNLNRSPPRPLDMMGPEDLPIYEYKEERKEPTLYREVNPYENVATLTPTFLPTFAIRLRSDHGVHTFLLTSDNIKYP